MCLDLETQVLQILKIFYSITTEHGIQETVYLGHKIFYTLQFHFRSVKIEKAPIIRKKKHCMLLNVMLYHL